MPGADGFLGKITPAMLARADRLRWVQSFTAAWSITCSRP